MKFNISEPLKKNEAIIVRDQIERGLINCDWSFVVKSILDFAIAELFKPSGAVVSVKFWHISKIIKIVKFVLSLSVDIIQCSKANKPL